MCIVVATSFLFSVTLAKMFRWHNLNLQTIIKLNNNENQE